MSYLNDIDSYYINSITSLHSIDHFISGGPSALQLQLEEALSMKTGTRKDLSSLVAAIKQPTEIYKNLQSTTIEEKTTSSSDELELDLLKEDLMCIVCKAMDVGAKNRLLECSDCHSLYHQECHRPVVSSEETESTWVCQNCKDLKKARTENYSRSHSSSKESKSYKSSSSSSSSHSYKSGSSKGSSSYKSSEKSFSSKSSSSNESRSSLQPNVNIMSAADKRLQNMKKKAAKLHDKR